jgi:hypothetical protein
LSSLRWRDGALDPSFFQWTSLGSVQHSELLWDYAMSNSDKTDVHIDATEQRKDILDHQVDACPTCKGELEDGFGLAGGGFGIYGFCPKCGRIVWKCQVEY